MFCYVVYIIFSCTQIIILECSAYTAYKNNIMKLALKS